MEFIFFVIYASIYIGLFATTFYVLSFIADKKKEKKFYTDEELPKATVIIPAYNEEKTIEKTISSILKSNYPDFEVLVIDDGSSDNTLKLAKKFESKKVRIFTKPNGGKGSALNFGIEKAEGEIIFTMDADTTVHKESMIRMARFFKEPKIMCVTPAMIIEKPKTIWERVQHIEYLTGLFLRKAFASLNSIYISPGAFSAYRKDFFDKYGGYDEKNATEDLEIALRIQSHGFVIENCPDAPAYTYVPKKFKELMIQRRRWYYGMIKNLIQYRHVISRKYGDMGAFVIPIALISIFFSVFVTIFYLIKTIFTVNKEIIFLKSINFQFSNITNINFYFIERVLYQFFSNPVILFVLLFMFVMMGYLHYASKKVGRDFGLIINIPLFFILFAMVFAFWWVISIIHAIFVKDVRWR